MMLRWGNGSADLRNLKAVEKQARRMRDDVALLRTAVVLGTAGPGAADALAELEEAKAEYLACCEVLGRVPATHVLNL